MTTVKFRLTLTSLDAVRMISDAIPVGEEQWTLVETTSGSRKERRERTRDERDKEEEDEGNGSPVTRSSACARRSSFRGF